MVYLRGQRRDRAAIAERCSTTAGLTSWSRTPWTRSAPGCSGASGLDRRRVSATRSTTRCGCAPRIASRSGRRARRRRRLGARRARRQRRAAPRPRERGGEPVVLDRRRAWSRRGVRAPWYVRHVALDSGRSSTWTSGAGVARMVAGLTQTAASVARLGGARRRVRRARRRASPSRSRSARGRGADPRVGPRRRPAAGVRLRRGAGARRGRQHPRVAHRMSSMRAAIYEHFGPAAEVLKVVEDRATRAGPRRGARARALSGVNPTDWKSRNAVRARCRSRSGAGAGRRRRDRRGRRGRDAGARRRAGVAATSPPGKRQWGTAAQWIWSTAGAGVPLPDRLRLRPGRGLGIPAFTAYHCLCADGPIDGHNVLVAGGAGAVGHCAIELAACGRRVISTVARGEKAALAARRAPRTVNYREGDAAAEILALAPGGVDRWSSSRRDRTFARPGGRGAQSSVSATPAEAT